MYTSADRNNGPFGNVFVSQPVRVQVYKLAPGNALPIFVLLVFVLFCENTVTFVIFKAGQPEGTPTTIFTKPDNVLGGRLVLDTNGMAIKVKSEHDVVEVVVFATCDDVRFEFMKVKDMAATTAIAQIPEKAILCLRLIRIC